MLLVTLELKTLLSISQNGINQFTLNKQLGNHSNMDIINASISLSSFPFSGCFQISAGKEAFLGIIFPSFPDNPDELKFCRPALLEEMETKLYELAPTLEPEMFPEPGLLCIVR